MQEFTIMFVDDEQNILKVMERIFKPTPYRVLKAESGQQALEMMEENPVDILITDQRMPVMTGTQLCKKVKELHPQVIRIILSGYADINDLIMAINQGEVYRFLRKPDDMSNMIQVVERAIEQVKVIRGLKGLLESMEQEGPKYHYQVDYSYGWIRMVLAGDSHNLTREQISSLIQCLVKKPLPNNEATVLGAVMARQNGKLTLNVEFGGGINVVVELPIEDDRIENGDI